SHSGHFNSVLLYRAVLKSEPDWTLLDAFLLLFSSSSSSSSSASFIIMSSMKSISSPAGSDTSPCWSQSTISSFGSTFSFFGVIGRDVVKFGIFDIASIEAEMGREDLATSLAFSMWRLFTLFLLASLGTAFLDNCCSRDSQIAY
ncbi:hypothetical protein PENTCL1PPCAC_25195, partial [Pristionchus entomophagus]